MQVVTNVSSQFLPGCVTDKILNFLVDKGCMHFLLWQTNLDRLQMVQRKIMAAMVTDSGLHFYKGIKLNGRLRNIPFVPDFQLCKIFEDVILKIEFLNPQICLLACS